MLSYGPKLNRSYGIYVPFMKRNVTLTTLFNKNNAFVGFNVDHDTYVQSKENQFRLTMYKDISESEFATTFLDLKTIKTNNLDIKLQFNDISPEFVDRISYVTNETVKVSKIKTNSGVFDSSLFVYVFNFVDFEEEFLYLFAERQHIDQAINKKVVRTYGLQMCSHNAFEYFSELMAHYGSKETKQESVDDVMRSVLT